ncbi:MAG: hybrid sensor histidine kinase/response regulator [Candidatus Binatia bacterium]
MGRLRHAASGEYRYFEARATPLLNADGTVRQWVGTCTDVDERRRGKERLENTVAERTKALQQANAALLRDMEERKKLEVELLQAQKMESIGTLAGGIAHDFNNVLNIIQGYTSVFSKYAGEKNEMAESLEAINEAVQRGAGVVRQLLTLARKTEARLEPTNVNGLIAGLTKLLSETFPKTIEMTLDLIAEPPLLMADPNQINQVILNLCVNARDAMPQGGKLLLKTAVVSGVELPQSFDGGLQERYVRLRVSDTGTGMALSVKQRIFEPFFTTKEPGQGTGLGLSVAYGIVASHGGFLDVTSELGQGTTFDIYLPLAKNNLESIASQRQPDGDGRRPGAGATILFVDDEIRQLRRMQNFLESEGLKVLAASDGAEAVEVHLRHKNDIAVVVLDFRLPKLNGIEAFRTMRNTQPNLKALIATGFPTREVEAQLAGGEMADIITKPYQLAEVLEKISELLEADRPRQ